MEVWRYAAGVATSKYGGLEVRCRCSDVEVWRSEGAMQAWRHGGIERWRYCEASSAGRTLKVCGGIERWGAR